MNPLFKSILPIFVFSWLFYSCDKEQEQIPSYLHISKFSFTSDPTTQGLGTYEIVGAKVFVNGKEIGNFEIPCTVPVLAEGTSYIEVYPNIKQNGSYSNQKYFKPYTGFIDTIKLKKGQIDTIQPVTKYRSNVKFLWIEDFEDQAISMIKSGYNNSDDSIVPLPTNTSGVDQPFSGSNYCGYINLVKDTQIIFERSSLFAYSIPNLGTDVYLELDVKSNQALQIGVYTDNNINVIQSPVMVVNSTDNAWKKVYVNLVSETGDLASGSKIRVFFGLYKSIDSNVDQYLMIDNIKLLYVQ